MTKGLCYAVGVVCFASSAALASADEAIEFVDDVDISGVLTLDEIYLRNLSGQDLDFYMSRTNGPWHLYRVPIGKAALIDARSLKIAIASALTDEEPDVETAPALAPGDITRNQVGD